MARALARHILVASVEAGEDLKSLIEGGADFTQLAKSQSQCPSGKQGVALGEFSYGDMVREFDELVFNGDLGKVHGPIQTDFGYHLIEITSRTDKAKRYETEERVVFLA